MYNPFSLEGKTILVTGASSGIGQSIAIECSKMGASIIITGRNKERLHQTFENLQGNNNHHMIPADLSDSESLNFLISQIESIDGLALCAGVGMTMPCQFCTTEKISNLFAINLNSSAELLRLLYKKKKITEGGSVVCISSVGGLKVFNVGNAVYGASKAALSSFMKFCALEYSIRKIRINCLCPGMVETPFIHDTMLLTNEQLDNDMKQYPLKRYGQPEDIAYFAIYLLSDASSWVTGQDFVIDGGLSIRS